MRLGRVVGLALFAGAFTAMCWFGSDTFIDF